MRYLHDTKLSVIKPIGGDRFIVKLFSENNRDSHYTFMDNLGRINDEMSYFALSERDDKYFEARPHSDMKTMILLDKDGREIYSYPASAKVELFDSGIATFKPHEGRNYFITETGEVWGQEFKNVIGFANGLGIVQLFNEKFVAVNNKMDIVSPEFDYIHPFKNANYSWAIIDKKVVVIDRKFNIVGSEYTDENGNKKPYGHIYLIDENNIILNHDFRSNNEENAKCSMISIDGKKLGNSHLIISESSEGIYRVHDEEGTSYVDTTGKYIVEGHYINCSDFSEGVAVIGSKDKDGDFVYAFLKKDGKFLTINSSYLNGRPELSKIWVPYAQDFSEGYGAIILRGESRHLINAEGRVLKGAYSYLDLFSDGYAKFQTKNKKRSFVDKETLEPIDREFDSASSFKNGYAVVCYDGKIDVMDTDLKMLSNVSRIAFEIEQNPRNITRVPEEYYFDERLMTSLFDLAVEVAKMTNDSEFISISERIGKRISERIEEAKQFEKLVKGKVSD